MTAPIFLSEGERRQAEILSQLTYCNPFLPERIELEREMLGHHYVSSDLIWSKRAESVDDDPNIDRIVEQAGAAAETLRERVLEAILCGERGGAEEQKRLKGREGQNGQDGREERGDSDSAAADLELYEDLVLFYLYHRYQARFRDVIRAWIPRRRASAGRIPFYREFVADMDHFLTPARAAARSLQSQLSGLQSRTPPLKPEPTDLHSRTPPLKSQISNLKSSSRSPEFVGSPAAFGLATEIPHVFACFFQIRRAFHHVFENILGDSMPAARLRAAIWQSVFTHDMRRYRRALYNRMGDFTCLITGPSGTGKELVARAIGLSRYIPFDPETETFTEDFAGSFHPLNLSALTPTLIESELFGHRRGAFTGALQDRVGWLEVCPPLGTVFLDEIGDLDPAIQVKLLRVLQSRTFQRIGETEERHFRGKIIAATNRDLAAEVRAGRFREDFFYRLCSDRIATPSLREQIQDSPTTLLTLVSFLARRAVGETEAGPVVEEVVAFIESQLGRDYAWPGNVRELEQCVRNVLIRRDYRPLMTRDAAGDTAGASSDPDRVFVSTMLSGSLTAEELLTRYTQRVYDETGSYQETARRLDVDPRTVKARVSHPR